jgi:serine/threonine protein kinase
MGIVCAATHLELDQRVAIKFMRPDLSDRDEISCRFLNEARAAASLSSPHVARILDVGHLDDGCPYIVMEFLRGRDLASALAHRGALPVPEAADYVIQACEALAEAHRAGIVHRDIKPENLFLADAAGDKPILKILDFGISKRILMDADAALTRPGASIGSPCYMPPEQMSGTGDTTLRADIWSLGVVLYELLTGARPFEAVSIPETFACVLRDQPVPPSVLRPSLSPELDAIVLRCLQKSPEQRFATVAELASALEVFSMSEPLPSERTAAALGLRLPSQARSNRLRVTTNREVQRRYPPQQVTRSSPRAGRQRWRFLALASTLAGTALGACAPGWSPRIVSMRDRAFAEVERVTGIFTTLPLNADIPSLPPYSGPLTAPTPYLFARSSLAVHEVHSAKGIVAKPRRGVETVTPSPGEKRRAYRAWLAGQGLRPLDEVLEELSVGAAGAGASAAEGDATRQRP